MSDGRNRRTNVVASSTGADPVVSTSYTYNSADELTNLTHTNSNTSATIDSYALTYNADGQITQMIDADGTTNYAYDNDGDLTSASGSALPATESYSYDSNGNRTSTSLGTGTSSDTTGTDNELTSDGTYDYAYDADGNLITQTDIATGATINYTWDYRNRLTEITDKTAGGTTTETIQYTYNAANQRISQVVKNGSGQTTLAEYYIYDTGGNLILVLNASGSITHTYLNGPNGQALSEDAGGGNVTWLLPDQQGSVRDVVNNSATVIDHIKYDAYGNILSQTSSANQPRFAYAGMVLDPATGLYYDNARYYDSSTGTFISQDPKGFGGGNTNLYGYVNEDPTNLIDPSGLSPKGGSGGGWGSGGGGGGGSGGAAHSGGWNTPGAYHYTNDDIGSSWISNYLNALFSSNPDDYGTAGQVTTPQSVQTAQEVLAVTGVGLITLGAGIALAPAAAGVAAEAYATASAYFSYAQMVAGATGLFAGGAALAEDDPELLDQFGTEASELLPAVDNEISQGINAVDDYLSGNGGTAAESESSINANAGGGCFIAGTPVLCAEGKRPIEQVRIGQRAITSPLVQNESCKQVNSKDYRVIRLQYIRPEDGDEIELSLLRRAPLVANLGPGDSVRLSVFELKIEDRATVLGIEACPPIDDGPGQVVTGTIRSTNLDVRLLRLRGLDYPIEVTATHPFFSEDALDFVSVQDLTHGERLRTRSGMVEVQGVDRKFGRWEVFNLEIDKAHQYYVSEQEVLAHNAGPCFGGDSVGGVPLPGDESAPNDFLFQVTPPEGMTFGNGDFGAAMHQNITQALQSASPDVPFTFNVAPGDTGPDIEVPLEFAGNVGFQYGEIKPVGESGLGDFSDQVQDWAATGRIQPQSSVQLITYDANGNVRLSYTNVPE